LNVPVGCSMPRPTRCASGIRVSLVTVTSAKVMKDAMKVRISAEAKCRPGSQ
jgi:hypothetical protein